MRHRSFVGGLGMIAVLVCGCSDNRALDHECNDCLPCEECVETENGAICAAIESYYFQCSEDGNVHSFDSCDVDEGISEDCPDQNAECINSSAEEANCECVSNWDPDVECKMCLGNWDPANNCETCENSWVDDSDDCGTCPGNWDLETDCSECFGNWDPQQDCEECANNWVDEDNDCGTCPGNWDPAEDCAVCENSWIDEDNDCGTCPGNWDPEKDCAACLDNWDPNFNCEQCLPGWSGKDCETQEECIRYVNIELNSPYPNGNGWPYALDSIEGGVTSALNAIQTNTLFDSCQLWVAKGDYSIGSSYQNNTLRPYEEVPMYGGFDGSELTLGERDFEKNATVLNGNGSSLSVVTIVNDCVLDGFTITGGSGGTGSGIDNNLGYNIVLRNCEVHSNETWTTGGALFVDSNGTAEIDNCTFYENYSDGSEGGCAIVNLEGSLNISNSIFRDNQGDSGGAIMHYEGQLDIENSIFTGNRATFQSGGAIYILHDSPVHITNSLFVDNQADFGGGVYNFDGEIVVANSIFFDNTAPSGQDIFQSSTGDGTITVIYSMIEQGWSGAGNINLDPQFEDQSSLDFHLLESSPCIDAADGNAAPSRDFDGRSRFDDPNTSDTGTGDPTYVDIGPFEYQG